MTREEFIQELKMMARDAEQTKEDFKKRADAIRPHDPVLAKMVVSFGQTVNGIAGYAERKLDELGVERS